MYPGKKRTQLSMFLSFYHSIPCPGCIFLREIRNHSVVFVFYSGRTRKERTNQHKDREGSAKGAIASSRYSIIDELGWKLIEEPINAYLFLCICWGALLAETFSV